MHKLVVMADDDAEDCMLAEFALNQTLPGALFCSVEDGEELMAWLAQRAGKAPLPDLIVLDLNMPRVDGRQALVRIKSDPVYKHIPIVVLTTSGEKQDLEASVKAGAEKFFTKPVLIEEWKEIMKSLAPLVSGVPLPP